jgi:dihydrofolate synthase/folylpolyglutamate synthase
VSATAELAYLSSLERFGIKLGLEQIRALLDGLDRPEQAFPALLIAGTNGKGSVAAMIERALRAAGLRTGLYTSPHLVRIEERFAIDGQPVSTAAFGEAAGRVRRSAERLAAPPSYFEATTAIALDLFRETRIDIAVLEVGLGGRLDATNAVPARAVAITSVDYDHEQWLGSTLEAIAGEKAGVIKAGTAAAVLGDNPPIVVEIVRTRAERMGARFTLATEGTTVSPVELRDGRGRFELRTPARDYGAVTLALRGRHQVANAVTAVRTLEALPDAGLAAVPEAAMRAGLEAVAWPARLEAARWRGTELLIDGAHNPAGARALAAYVLETAGRPLPLVAGIMGDKAIDAMLAAFAPAASSFFFTAVQSARAARADDLAARARRLLPRITSVSCATPLDALERATASGDAPVVVAGSLYLAGEIRALVS